MMEEIFKLKKPNFLKLKEYGFVELQNKYQFKTQILGGQFTLFVFVTENGEVSTKLIDCELQEEYILHLVNGTGGFVGKIKTELENVLTDIRDKCFEKDVFKSKQAHKIINYITQKYGDELEYLWPKFPTNAIWRRADNAKWYALLIVLPKSKLGINSDEVVDVIDLRIAPEDVEKVIDNAKYFKAYHMNKKHWFTICLDGSVPTKTIKEFVDKSYALAKK